MKKKKEILIIEDYEEISRTFESILQKNGYATDIAQTSEEAMKKIRANSYAAAIIDAELPDSTNILLKLANFNIIKIVVTDYPEKAKLNGADACLMKIVKPNELLCLMQKMLSKN